MRGKFFICLIILTLLTGILACNLPEFGTSTQSETPTELTIESQSQDEPDPETTDPIQETQPTEEDTGIEAQPVSIEPGERIQPTDLIYLGAFRLPDPSGVSNWDYSGHGLTYCPKGDPSGGEDGHPGSLYGVGHDHQLHISEISIPVPINSRDLNALNTATTLQPFADLTDGIFSAEEMTIPRVGIEYLPAQDNQSTDKIHFVWGQHFQDFEYSHGWAEPDLSNPQAAGPWFFDGYTNYVTSDYIFEIPQEWADSYAPGMRLATGRAREGLWSGRGPGLFAYAPWQDGNPPEPNATLTTMVPLLLYGTQEPGLPDIVSDESMAMNGYKDADHWMGGAWLTTDDKSALIFVGTKALGEAWYGFANGLVWPHDCAENNTCPDPPEWPHDDRGFWAEDFEAQMIFYDPAELAAVATGQMETWEPQPYATMSLENVLYDPDIDLSEYRRDLLGATAFDRVNGILYVIERLTDEYKSVVHIWKLAAE
jgi:hypothetical protein